MARASDKIEAFISEYRAKAEFIEAAKVGDQRTKDMRAAEDVLRWMCIVDHPAAVEACDDVCQVITTTEPFKQRLLGIIPILAKLQSAFRGEPNVRQ